MSRDDIVLLRRSAMARRLRRAEPAERRRDTVTFSEELDDRMRHAWWDADPVISEEGQDRVWRALRRCAIRRPRDGDGG